MKKTKENFNKNWFVMYVDNMNSDEMVVTVRKENLFTKETAKHIIDSYK